jgi:GH15 family glucan-1,4-alpha-glucosidase
MTNLIDKSIEIIMNNQDVSGAYVACPTFTNYMYSWFRDGSYIAYAMDIVGEFESAGRFHDWAAQTINKHEETVERAVETAHHGEWQNEVDFLHTRYTLKGEISDDEWPNFQLDGFGTWLWALKQHSELSQSPISACQQKAARLTLEYLSSLWKVPCSDCWEEFPNFIHPHTLAAIYGGIQAIGDQFGDHFESLLNEILQYILEHNLKGGHFVKFGGSPEVDTSLLGLSVPYQLFSPHDVRIKATVECIEATLLNGGVKRYPSDTYYGGGDWVVLAGWLGWYYAEAGEREEAIKLRDWMEEQADSAGTLPEQVPTNLIDETYLEIWRKRWGQIAQPLLWSHAKYIILHKTLNPDH